MSRWVPLESNPQVMNEFLEKMGVPKPWVLADVYGLDEEILSLVPKPSVALILLFPLTEKAQAIRKEQMESSSGQGVSSNVFFLKQYISNACGTIALIHAIANNTDHFELGDGSLKKFIEDTKGMTPDQRGKALQENDAISEVHDSIAQQGQTAAPESDAKLDTHFIVFTCKDGSLYELDGRKDSPINHGSTTSETFLSDAAKVCKKFMDADPEENRFAIMGLSKSE